MTAPMPDSTAGLARRRLWLGALHHLALADGDFSEAEAHQLQEDLQRELPGSEGEQLAVPGSEALVHRFYETMR